MKIGCLFCHYFNNELYFAFTFNLFLKYDCPWVSCFSNPQNQGKVHLIYFIYELLSGLVSSFFSWPVFHLSYFSSDFLHLLIVFILELHCPVLHEFSKNMNMKMVTVFQKLSSNLINLMERNIGHIVHWHHLANRIVWLSPLDFICLFWCWEYNCFFHVDWIGQLQVK